MRARRLSPRLAPLRWSHGLPGEPREVLGLQSPSHEADAVFAQAEHGFFVRDKVNATGCRPVPFGNPAARPELASQVKQRCGALLDHPGHLRGLGRVRLEGDDTRGCGVAEQIVPSRVVRMALTRRLVKVEAVHELHTHRFCDVSSFVIRNSLDTVADRGPKIAASQRARHRTAHDRSSADALFTARRTESANRELKPARPPHPDTASLSSPGSRLEMSVATT